MPAPGGQRNPEPALFTTVLTEDINYGEGYAYTAICECGWEGPSHHAIPTSADKCDTASDLARADLVAHVSEEHPEAIR